MTRSSSKQEGMKIQHITYEEARAGWPPTRPPPATKEKVKGYFSRLSHSLDYGIVGPKSPRDDRPTTRWPRMESGPSDGLSDVEHHSTQKHRAERAATKERADAVTWSGDHSAPAAPTPSRRREGQQAQTDLRPSLRRKSNSKTIVRDKLNHEKSTEETKRSSEARKERFMRSQSLRLAILEGKLEKVVPPTAQHNYSMATRHAPPRPTSKPSHNPSPPLRSSLTSKANSLVENLRTSAAILDETRRELAGKFRPPFEYLNYPSFSLSCRSSKVSASRVNSESEESFGCIGEESHGESGLRTDGDRGSTGNFSGKGTNPWTDTAPRNCRMCKKAGAGGLRDLCRQCEMEFMRSKPVPANVGDHRISWSSSIYSDGEELKPTPPLKNRHVLLEKKLAGDGKSNPGKELPPIPIEVESDDEEFEQWQREELKKAERVFGIWSNDYANKDYAGFIDQGRHTPLITTREEKGKEGPSKINTSFYDFSDDSLDGIEKARSR